MRDYVTIMRLRACLMAGALLVAGCAADGYDWEIYDQGSYRFWEDGEVLELDKLRAAGVTFQRWDDRYFEPKGLQIFADDESAIDITIGGLHTKVDRGYEGEGRDVTFLPKTAGEIQLQFLASNRDETRNLIIVVK